jgi:hypothetical protein
MMKVAIEYLGERVMFSIFDKFQQSLCRVVKVVLPTHSRCTHTTLPTTQPKMAIAIFGFGLTHAPYKDPKFVRKYRQVWKVTPERTKKMNNKH